MKIKLGKKTISENSQTYFIADIAANHNGSLSKAKDLICMAAEAGANAAKFQNFFAKTIVSDKGFKKLKIKTHQSNWKDSVYNVYKKAELPIEWTPALKEECKKNNIDYLTAPYDSGILKYLNKFVSAWKIGSGDLSWIENIKKISSFNKPLIIATGASQMIEVEQVYKEIIKINTKIILMQCNTNYTASKNNFNYINLNVLKTFKNKFPKCILGLSDHTLGHETVIGAITLGARVVEKHFTDRNSNKGPDHYFSMNPKTWREMIDASRNIEIALGDGIKRVEKNELSSRVVQRRAIYTKKNIIPGDKILRKDLILLRPCPNDAISPLKLSKIINKKAKKYIKKDDYLKEGSIAKKN
jgi:sialic acid synthase SpsE